MKRIQVLGAVTLAATALLAAAPTAEASSMSYDFMRNLDGNTSTSGAQFTMTVSETAPNQVSFLFQNSGPPGRITGIYMYDGVILGNTASIVNNHTGVIAAGGNPEDLPGGAPYGLVETHREFYAVNPQAGTGVHAGQSLLITMNLQADKTFADLIAAIEFGRTIDTVSKFQTGMLVIGVRAQSLPDGDGFDGSDGFLITIPLPAPVWMGLAGLVGVGVLRRRMIGS